jgi:aldehyde dehydrogenase
MELVKDVVPPGVINIVTGRGSEIGDALATNPGIAKLAFTGSTATGARLLKACHAL